MKKLIILLPALAFCISVFGQTLPIKLLDLKVLSENKLKQQENVDVSVKFKVNDAANSEKAVICLGTSAGSCDIASIEATFVPNGSGYALNYNGQLFPFNNYDGKVVINMTKEQYSGIAYCKVYVVDKQGQNSNELVYPAQ